jgi:hypothetical protein
MNLIVLVVFQSMLLWLSACESAATPAADAQVLPPECWVTLSQSGCSPTHEKAVAPIDCTAGRPLQQTAVANCDTLRRVVSSLADSELTCDYDGEMLVGSRNCSKPIGGCACLYGGRTNEGASCTEATILDRCNQDARTR